MHFNFLMRLIERSEKFQADQVNIARCLLPAHPRLDRWRLC